MQLQFIERDKLIISSANMRHARKAPDIADLLPSMRARGIVVPLVVRANGAPGRFEIVAGRRRFFAAEAIAAERAETGGEGASAFDRLPCAVIAPGDDAAALEASLIENVARCDPHEVEQWQTFTRLVAREGRSADEIALTFGLTGMQVKRILALGNLLPKIRELYAKGEIDAASIRLLTMASKARQRDWLALVADPDRFAPAGHSLKAWLFGGAAIPTSAALFDLADYSGEIVADLFGEGGYFACAETFWAAQRAAVAARAKDYVEAGWREAVIVEPGSYFNAWEYERTPKRKGGKVYIVLSQRGEAAFHEGYLSRKDKRARGHGDDAREAARPVRPELTAGLQTYIDLHRHAAVRARLIGQPRIALRLMLAHLIGGSHLVRLTPEPQRGGSDAIAESVELCAAETAFDAERRAVLAMLGFDADAPHVIGGAPHADPVPALFLRLLETDEEAVLRILTVVMGEALAAGSMAVEALGQHLAPDMADLFSVDEAFFEIVRDKEILAAMVAELAGEEVARANRDEKAKGLKALIRDCLAGENGRAKVDRWVPRWLAFPPRAYTRRGGVGALERFEALGAIAAELTARETDEEARAEAHAEPDVAAAAMPEARDRARAKPDAAEAQDAVQPPAQPERRAA